MQNFVGLSVHDGYITCGSETNEVSILCSAYTFLGILTCFSEKTLLGIEFCLSSCKLSSEQLCVQHIGVLGNANPIEVEQMSKVQMYHT